MTTMAKPQPKIARSSNPTPAERTRRRRRIRDIAIATANHMARGDLARIEVTGKLYPLVEWDRSPRVSRCLNEGCGAPCIPVMQHFARGAYPVWLCPYCGLADIVDLCLRIDREARS